jgi:hypothetical protein
MEADI